MKCQGSTVMDTDKCKSRTKNLHICWSFSKAEYLHKQDKSPNRVMLDRSHIGLKYSMGRQKIGEENKENSCFQRDIFLIHIQNCTNIKIYQIPRTEYPIP